MSISVGRSWEGRFDAANRGQRGLTMIELMVTLAVAALLLAVAVPSFVSTIQSNRVLTEVNALVGDLQYARSEAIKEGVPVSVCVSSNGTTCLAANTWHSGWIVFPDPTASGVVAPGVTPLRVHAAFTGGDTFVASPQATWVSYSRDGFALNLPAGGVTLTLHTSPEVGSATRCLTLTLVGHQTVESAGTGTCS
jgi:type IV fimbrial biogenesis protein FimT